jgi:hypothetical protein
MGFFIEDDSVMNGVFAVMGIVGAFMLMIFNLATPPPPPPQTERRSSEPTTRIYTRDDLWGS